MPVMMRIGNDGVLRSFRGEGYAFVSFMIPADPTSPSLDSESSGSENVVEIVGGNSKHI